MNAVVRPKSIDSHVQRSIELIKWIAESLDGLKIPTLPTERRTQLSAATLHVAIEHHQAIVLLVEQGLHASAFALMRVLFEAYVRGCWLATAASDHEVARADHDEFPPFGSMVKSIEACGAAPADSLTVIKAKHWDSLNSLTHTGGAQRELRLTPEGLGYPNSDTFVHDSLKWGNTIGLLAARGLSILAGDPHLYEAIDKQAEEILNFTEPTIATGEGNLG